MYGTISNCPSKGTATINEDKDNIVPHVPSIGQYVIDTFEYTHQDNGGLQSSAVVAVDVECAPLPEPIPPVANCDSAVTQE